MEVRLTERAVAAVRQLERERAGEGEHLRIWIKSGGCSGMEYAMGFGLPESGDERFEVGDLVYYVERKSLERLAGSEVDFDDGLSGKGFEVRNPNASSTCGCGRSFSSG
ncbi:MAG: hypothetical protein RL648_1015 [Verrucomicrobiota bacterium]|jgi:iron-sulfur cluster assembly accessory protein